MPRHLRPTEARFRGWTAVYLFLGLRRTYRVQWLRAAATAGLVLATYFATSMVFLSLTLRRPRRRSAS